MVIGLNLLLRILLSLMWRSFSWLIQSVMKFDAKREFVQPKKINKGAFGRQPKSRFLLVLFYCFHYLISGFVYFFLMILTTMFLGQLLFQVGSEKPVKEISNFQHATNSVRVVFFKSKSVKELQINVQQFRVVFFFPFSLAL